MKPTNSGSTESANTVECNYKYVSLLNRSPSAYSQNTDTQSVNECASSDNYNIQSKNKCKKLPHYNSDQLIPQVKLEKTESTSSLNNENDKNSFYYVNKNGQVVKSQVLPLSNCNMNELDSTSSKITSNNELLCADLILETYKKQKPNKNKKSTKQTSLSRSVPSQSNLSFNSINISNPSLVQRDSNGNTFINTNLTIDEPNIEIDYDHVKYVNMFSIICCWCFPITGIISIIFSRWAKKYFELRDMVNAKKYLKRSEWLLLMTFFFGFTLLALAFALLEAYLFRNSNDETNSRVLFHTGIYHS
jgi:hypothetical protein